MVGNKVHSLKAEKRDPRRSILMTLAFVVWAAFSYFAAQFIVLGLYWVLGQVGFNVEAMSDALFMTISTALSWTVTLIIALWVPYLVLKQRTTLTELGLHRLPTWSELGLAPAGYIVSTAVAAVVIYGVSQLFPGFDAEQAQDVGFSNLVFRYEYIVAFTTLVVVAPIVEEIFFRGYLYGKLKAYIPTWAAILIVSALFGIAHGQVNVAIMTFVMGIFLCLLRDLTGSLWPAIMMHMIRNGIAFFFLFIAPTALL